MATKKRVNTTITVKSDRYYIIVSYYVKAATGEKQRKQKWIATEYTTADKSVKRKLEDIRKDVQAEYERFATITAIFSLRIISNCGLNKQKPQFRTAHIASIRKQLSTLFALILRNEKSNYPT